MKHKIGQYPTRTQMCESILLPVGMAGASTYTAMVKGCLTLLRAIRLLQPLARLFQHWFTGSSRSRRGYKLRHTGVNKCHRHSPQKPEWLKTEIIHLKATMPHAGCRTIADTCNRRFATSRKITVGKTWVHQVLQRHDYEIKILRRKLKHAKPRAMPRNRIWGIDLTGKTDAKGTLHYLLGILDHGSRSLLYLQSLHDKTTQTLMACINETIHLYGKPKVIRTDNESMFTSRAFSRWLKRLGIRHQRTTPGCPWQNGRIERLFGTLKQKLDQLIYSPLPLAGEGLGERVREQLNFDLNTFRYWYNHVRPHQNLDGCTPAEAWSGIDPYKKPPKQERWFEAWDGLLTGYELRY